MVAMGITAWVKGRRMQTFERRLRSVLDREELEQQEAGCP